MEHNESSYSYSPLLEEGHEGDNVEVRSRRNSSVSHETNYSKASIWSCFFTLSNTIIGSGMLGLPYAYSRTGWVLGTFLLLVCGSSSAFALHNLSLCALRQKGPTSFYSVAHKAMPSLTLVIDAAVAIKCFGVATSYLIVIGGLMPQVMEQFGASHALRARELWVFLGFTVVAPLSFLRNFDSLKFTSTMSIAFVFFLTILVALYSGGFPGLDPCDAVDDGETCTGSHTIAVVNVNTFKVMSIFVFGFTCHQNIFAVTNELHNPTSNRVNRVIIAAITLAFCIYMTVAACGYKTYGAEVESNILLNYPENYLTSIARMFVSLLVSFTYPLQCHPCRRSVLTLLRHFDNYRSGRGVDNSEVLNPVFDDGHGGVSSSSSGSPTNAGGISHIAGRPVGSGDKLEFSNAGDTPGANGGTDDFPEVSEYVQKVRFMIVTACFLGLSLLIAISVSDLGVVLALVGATGSTCVSYILPGFFYYFTFRNEGPAWQRNLALLQGCIGLCIVPVCLTFIFI